MDLVPLKNSGDVSEREFTELFSGLGDNFPRALKIFQTLGPIHSFSLSNVIHLGRQKGNVDEVLDALEEWCEVVSGAPDVITAHVDTKRFFDVVYSQFFMTPEDTISGMGPFMPKRHGNVTILRLAPEGKSRIWLPQNGRN